jgi:hypothetical protein
MTEEIIIGDVKPDITKLPPVDEGPGPEAPVEAPDHQVKERVEVKERDPYETYKFSNNPSNKMIKYICEDLGQNHGVVVNHSVIRNWVEYGNGLWNKSVQQLSLEWELAGSGR